MRSTEQSAKTPFLRSSLLATLRAFLRIAGSGASPRLPVTVAFARRRALPGVAVGCVLVTLGLFATAGPALAVNPLRFERFESEGGPPVPFTNREKIFATRAYMVATLISETQAPFQWHAEYAPAEAGHIPPLNSPSWIAAGGDSEPASSGDVWHLAIGHKAAGGAGVGGGELHHLQPATTYYARFVAKYETGEEAEATHEFRTAPVSKPEFPTEREGAADMVVNQAMASSPHSAFFDARIESGGAQTEYHFDYTTEPGNPASWAPFTSGAAGTVTVAEDFVDTKATVIGLAPETTYFVRLTATNEQGTTEEVKSFATLTAKPTVFTPDSRNVTATTAHLREEILPAGSETEWRFESTTEPFNSASWVPLPGAAGTVSRAEAEALEEARASGRGFAANVEAELTGLDPATTYYVRLFAKNEAGEAITCFEGPNGAFEHLCEPISTATHGIARFVTSGPPTASAFATHGLHGESLRLLGTVNPNSVLTSEEQVIAVEGAPTGGTFTLTFEGQTTAPLAFDAPTNGANGVREALETLSSIHNGVYVIGHDGGPYTVVFNGPDLEKKNEPQITADASGLTPSGAVTVTTTQQGGEGYDTHAHFEYVSQEQFAKTAWAGAAETPSVDLGSGNASKFLGADLPALTPGETYRYRIAASNTSPGEVVVHGAEQTLTVPTPPPAGPAAPCANQATHTGPSANLPDCRSYEQLTPADKSGTQEIYNYGGSFGIQGALPGEDGNHLMYDSPLVKWGAGPDAGQSPYFFSRADNGWQLAAATAQPEAGIDTSVAQLFDPNLTKLAFAASFATAVGSASKTVEFRAGPPGGPYATVASIPRKQLGGSPDGGEVGWIAASEDFSKLILQVEDHKLLEQPTATKSGLDLYEYSGGELRQVNLGAGTCGARVANGAQGHHGPAAHAVSADGRRVFFEAVPGGLACSKPKHLYVRVDGGAEDAETIDLGAYGLLAANPQGSEVLLEKQLGETHEVLLYEVEHATLTPLFSEHEVPQLRVSEDLAAIYLISTEQLAPEAPAVPKNATAANMYRYDVSTKTLDFVAQAASLQQDPALQSVSSSPDGRYLYFRTQVLAGLPGGGQELESPSAANHGQTAQVYRYDSVEHLVQCVSCASSYDPEPRLSALFTESGGGGVDTVSQGTPSRMIASADGNYVFFDTPAALLPSDVDGEVPPEHGGVGGGEDTSPIFSLSSDVYEWRKPGVGGCARPQGCLALITSGRGGHLNILLGTTGSGRDVFFSTVESLLPRDNDTAADIYDAREGGGFPEPKEPAICEGDACSTPFAAPNDLTPSSATFQGAGNVLASSLPEVKPTPKPKAKRKRKCRAKARRKCKAKARRTGKKATRGARGRHTDTTGRVGR